MPGSTDSLSGFPADSLFIQGPSDSMSMWPIDSMSAAAEPSPPPPFLFPDGKGINSLGEAVTLGTNHHDWIFWVFLGALVLIASMRFSFPRRFNQTVSALFSERNLVNMLREGDLFTERIMLGLMGVYIGMLGLLLMIHGNDIGLLPGFLKFSPLTWAMASLGVLLWWLLRSLIVWIVGFIFKTFDATSLYLSRMLSMNMGMGMMVLVLLPLAWYGGLSWLISAILLVILAFNIYRIVRSTGDAMRLTGYGLNYLLIFSLAIEVLPLLLLAGFVRHNVV